MEKRFFGIITAVVLTVSLLSGCGGASKDVSTSAAGVRSVAPEAANESHELASVSDLKGKGEAGEVKKADASNEQSVDGNVNYSFSEAQNAVNSSVPNPILDQRKVIRSANITVEADNFDTAYGRINTAILGIGFIQETNINTERVYTDGVQKLVKRGVIVLRVERSKFDKVLNGLKEIGSVMNWGIQGEDVTEKYFDTESRLKLLRLEEERVLGYLKKLDNPDKIVTYESRLTNIRHEIESLTGTIRKLSDLVDLSTITVNINEKYPGSDKPAKERTYWDRMWDKFSESLRGVIEFCGNLIIFIIAALPVLILLGLFAWIIIFFYKKIARYARGKNIVEKRPAAKEGDISDKNQ